MAYGLRQQNFISRWCSILDTPDVVDCKQIAHQNRDSVPARPPCVDLQYYGCGPQHGKYTEHDYHISSQESIHRTDWECVEWACGDQNDLWKVTSQNVDKPKRRQPKRRQTETSTNRNVDKPKRRQTETSTNQNVDKPKRRQTKTSTDRNVDKPKRRQTKTSTLGNLCIIIKIHCIWYIINTFVLTKPLNKRHGEKPHSTAGPQLDHWTYGVDELSTLHFIVLLE